MKNETSVVTSERFTTGLTYNAFLAQIKVNKDHFLNLYEHFNLTEDDAAFFRKVTTRPDGPKKMMVLGEDWCPDVYRGLPMMARIAESCELDMRVFPRDSNIDIMNEFLKDGKHQSIPVAVFYTGDHRYICHWIERPALANIDRSRIEAEVKAQNPLIDDASLRTQVRDKNNALFPIWQQASVEEIRTMLSKDIGIQ
jgi:hypothetical protein